MAAARAHINANSNPGQNPAESGAQYRLAQAVLSGTARGSGMPVSVAREIVEKTPEGLRREYMRGGNPGYGRHLDDNYEDRPVHKFFDSEKAARVYLRLVEGEGRAAVVEKVRDRETGGKRWGVRLVRYKGNPESDSASMFESFHGGPSEGIVEFEETEHYHGNLAELGVMVGLKVRTVAGEDVTLGFARDESEDDSSSNPKTNPWWPFDGSFDRHIVYHVPTGDKLTAAATHAGHKIYKTPGGEYVIPALDRETRLESLKEAKKFAGAWKGRNPKTKLDLILDGISAGKGEVTFDVRDGYTEEQKERIIRTAKERGLHAASDGKHILVRKLNPAKGPIGSALSLVDKGTRYLTDRGPIGDAYKAAGSVGGYLDRQLGRVAGNPRITWAGDLGSESDPLTDEDGNKYYRKDGKWFENRRAHGTSGSYRGFVESTYPTGILNKLKAGKLKASSEWGVDPSEGEYIVTSVRKRGKAAFGAEGRWAFSSEDAAKSRMDDLASDPETEALVSSGGHLVARTSGFGTGYKGDRVAQRFIQTKIKNPASDDSYSASSVLLCSNESGTQVYLQGGDQSLDIPALKIPSPDRDSIVIGEAWGICYSTRKSFDKFALLDYCHGFGEESAHPRLRKGADLWEDARPPEKLFSTGQLPTLRYDNLNSKLYLDGGIYTIKPEGITE